MGANLETFDAILKEDTGMSDGKKKKKKKKKKSPRQQAASNVVKSYGY
jgi:hypothetical protein